MPKKPEESVNIDGRSAVMLSELRCGAAAKETGPTRGATPEPVLTRTTGKSKDSVMQATTDGTGALRSWEEKAARHRMQWCASPGAKATRRPALGCGDSETGRPGESDQTPSRP